MNRVVKSDIKFIMWFLRLCIGRRSLSELVWWFNEVTLPSVCVVIWASLFRVQWVNETVLATERYWSRSQSPDNNRLEPKMSCFSKVQIRKTMSCKPNFKSRVHIFILLFYWKDKKTFCFVSYSFFCFIVWFLCIWRIWLLVLFSLSSVLIHVFFILMFLSFSYFVSFIFVLSKNAN